MTPYGTPSESARFFANIHIEDCVRALLSAVEGDACVGLFAASDRFYVGHVSGVPKYICVCHMPQFNRATPGTIPWNALQTFPMEAPHVSLRVARFPESTFRGAVRLDEVIRIDAAWLATAPLDMRAGTDTALAKVIAVFGAAHPHHAYLWAYSPGSFGDMKAVVYDFRESRAGEHARKFLGGWKGSLVCDDFSRYKALIASGVSEVGGLAHAGRKFFDLHAANKSQLAQFALEQFAKIYHVEQQIKELGADDRREVRQQQSKPVLDALHDWMSLQRQKLPDSSATARALDYSLRQ